MSGTSEKVQARFVSDKDMAPMVPCSVAYLQRDRLKRNPTIPFVRLGDRCLYDPEAVIAALMAKTVGGPGPKRGRSA